MTPMIPIMLFGWSAVTLLLFATVQSRRAVITAMIGGWLLLPQASYAIPKLPDYDKMAAITLSVLLGAMLFDLKTLLRYRPSWMDIPIVVWCVWALPSSLSNGMGFYPGISAVVGNVIAWGLPYFIGRVYFRRADALRELAIGVFIGGLIYVPLCLIEIRISPLLHYYLYGFHQHQWIQTIRFGGWRPTVFLPHGLDVAIWMTMASVVGIALCTTGAARKVCGVPTWILLGVLLITTVLCKSLGAILLLAAGIAVMYFTRWTRLRIALLALLLIAPVYIAGRSTQTMSRDAVLSVMTQQVTFGRQASLDFRLKQEDTLTDKALQQPTFGWGPWGDFRTSETGKSLVRATDGMWLIIFGKYGLPGLIGFVATLTLPILVLLIRLPGRLWMTAPFAPAAGLMIAVMLSTIDALLNVIRSPVVFVVAGALATMALARLPKAAPKRRFVQTQSPIPAT